MSFSAKSGKVEKSQGICNVVGENYSIMIALGREKRLLSSNLFP